MRVLVSKSVTFSDSSFEVSKTGRVILPRSTMESCLGEVLRRGGAGHAVPATKSGAPLRLAVDLEVVDQQGHPWQVSLKTWQNVVSGQHRPTFVLENTASFMRAHDVRQGAVLSLCVAGGKLQLRTDVPLPRPAAKAAAGRQPARPPKRAAPYAPEPPSPLPARRRKAFADEEELCPLGVQAAHALVSMLRADSAASTRTARPPNDQPPAGAPAEAPPPARNNAGEESSSGESASSAGSLAAPPRRAPPSPLPPCPFPLFYLQQAMLAAARDAHCPPTFARGPPAGGRGLVRYSVTTGGASRPGGAAAAALGGGGPPTPAQPLPLERGASPLRAGSLGSELTGIHIVPSRQPSISAGSALPAITLAPERAPPVVLQSAPSAPHGGSFFSQAIIALDASHSGSLDHCTRFV